VTTLLDEEPIMFETSGLYDDMFELVQVTDLTEEVMG
jgi:hypothetical protein